MPGPLTGIRIFDLSHMAVGPWASMMLGQMGADVIKVEAPGEGDTIKRIRPSQKGMGILYINGNFNKRGIILDLKKQSDRETAYELIKTCDLFLENMKPGTVDRLGLGYDVVSKINPQMIYLTASAYGSVGPLGGEGGHDGTISRFCGWATTTGEPGGEPEIFRHHGHMDLSTACYNASAMLLGLLAREKTGRGQRVEMTMLAACLAIQASRVAEYLAGANPRPMGSACLTTVPHQAFQCQDKAYLAVGVVADEQWPRLCAALGLASLAEDPRFATNARRVVNRGELIPQLEKVFLTRPIAWWVKVLSEQKVPNGRILDFEDLRYHPTVLENEYIVQVDTKHWGMMHAPGVPWKFSKTPAEIKAGPAPGEHTAEVVREVREMAGAKSPRSRDLPPAIQAEAKVKPLSGVRVLDITQGLCGPYCSMQMADAGAEVIKVEPLEGDLSRGMVPPLVGGESAVYLSINRNKKSIAVDLNTEAGREIVCKLAKDVDVFVEDLGPGAADGLGLGYEALQATNPRLIYTSITAYGERGPLKDLPGAEFVVQAMADYTGSLGVIGEPPLRVGTDVANANTAVYAFQGILAALLHRQWTGEGQRVVLSMFGSLLHMRGIMWSALSNPDNWDGFHLDSYTRPPEFGYKTKDGAVFFDLRRTTEEQCRKFLTELGMTDCLDDPRFANGGHEATDSGRYGQEVRPLWERALKHRTMQEIFDLVKEANGAAVPLNDYDHLFAHPQMTYMEMVEEIDHPTAGKFRVLGVPWKLLDTPCEVGSRPPMLGEHTDEILAQYGFASEEIGRLREARVVK